MSINASKFNPHWQDKRLSELGTFNRGKSRHRPRNDPLLFREGKYPLVQTGEIKSANLYVHNHAAQYSEFGLQQSKLWPTGTLCITIAANIAETAILAYPMCFPDSIVGFNADSDQTSELFMHYVFTFIRKTIQNSASGSIQDNINIDYLTNLKFKVPTKEYQEKLAKILSNLDRKIELNNQINLELETMAMSLYDYWFIQFNYADSENNPYKSYGGLMVWNDQLKRDIPVDWEVIKLDSIFNFEKGIEPGADQYSDFMTNHYHTRFIRIADIDGDTFTYINCDEINAPLVNPYDFLVTFDGSVGKTSFGLEGSYSSGLRRIYDPSGKLDNSTAYFIFKDKRIIQTIHKYATGSILKHASDSIDKLDIPFNESVYLKFQTIVKPMYERMVANKSQNNSLIEIRNWILPMLMSGQITI